MLRRFPNPESKSFYLPIQGRVSGRARRLLRSFDLTTPVFNLPRQLRKNLRRRNEK